MDKKQLTVSIKHVDYSTGYLEFHENKSSQKYSYINCFVITIVVYKYY